MSFLSYQMDCIKQDNGQYKNPHGSLCLYLDIIDFCNFIDIHFVFFKISFLKSNESNILNVFINIRLPSGLFYFLKYTPFSVQRRTTL